MALYENYLYLYVGENKIAKDNNINIIHDIFIL